MVQVVVWLAMPTPDPVAADGEHLNPAGVGRVLNFGAGEGCGWAKEMGEACSEPVCGVPEFTSGFEGLGDEVPGPGIGGVLTPQSGCRFAGLAGASSVPQGADAVCLDQVRLFAAYVQ
ncbi:hypothetical protein [Streptomyces sp. NPDC002547]